MWRVARHKNKRLATLSIDTAVRFRSAADRAAFTRAFDAVTSLVARYHDETTPRGRSHRLVLAAYPIPSADAKEDAKCQ